MNKLFGTDGIRGIVNQSLTSDLAYKVGLATAKLLNTNPLRDVKRTPFEDEKPTVLIGTDTRPSRDLIFWGIACGLCAGGVNVISIGIIPTPAVAYLTKSYDFVSLGIMITASHNPKEYNGIKLIGPDGYKLQDQLEEQIESYISKISLDTLSNFQVKSPGKISYKFVQTANDDYMSYLKGLFSFNKMRKLKIAVDCANGAAANCKDIFEELGITADIYNANLDGKHINEGCGSMHLEFIRYVVKSGFYDCGIAFDGDADRCLLVDATGEIVDGDNILAIIGIYLRNNNRLANDTIIGTIMSNLGLVKFCETNNITFISSKVGDKYVLEEMIASKSSLGGEQSGHIIIKDYATTGDGILTALMILSIMSNSASLLSDLKKVMFKYPQISTQIVATPEVKNAFVANIALQQKIQDIVKAVLGDEGRAVVRPSGTENYIRIMVEGKDNTVISSLLNTIQELIIQSF